MTLFELELLLAKITYKPGTRFEMLKPSDVHSQHIQDELERNVVVLLHQDVIDAKEPNRKITVTYVGKIPFIDLEYLSADAVLGKVWYWLERMEVHEMKEWFKVSGQHYREPHPETKKRKQAQEAREAAVKHLTPDTAPLTAQRLEFAVLDELEVQDGRS